MACSSPPEGRARWTLQLLRPEAQIARQRAGLIAVEARADGGIVIGSRAEGLSREAPFGLARDRAAERVHFLQHGRVIARRHHHGHVLIILGGGADHGGAADIDVLDQLFQLRAGLGGHLFEAVEIHHHHVDGSDAVLGERLHVVGAIAYGEHAAGDRADAWS